MIHNPRLFFASLIMFLIGWGQILVVWEILAPVTRGFTPANGFLLLLAVGQIILAVLGLAVSFKRPR